MKKNIKLYIWLCYVNLFISSFTFGGGYVIIPLIRKYYVSEKKLFSEHELLEMAAIAQSSPGAIAVNLSVLAGKKACGLPGIIISCICSVIPPIVIIAIVSNWYSSIADNLMLASILKGMQACVAALIVDLILNMYQLIAKEKSRLLHVLIWASFVCCAFLHIHVMIILAASSLLCIAGLLIQTIKKENSQ